MKAFFAREFLWLLLTLVLAVPLAFLWLAALDLVSAQAHFTDEEKVFVLELFLLAYAISFVGIYLVRMVVAAIKSLALQPAKK
ncbi:hypothetical protein QWY85_08965 [Neolewinella lacunae]|uniref:Uncharacterized protein n=1 Tax=Neolewinella lacunae TaxID=1517758 RepID=A0A923PSG1_9BACT|nr:hypothetical protein [Neolewinella lacunae]MBC6996648.1 hypothetical protein [Neolewinella lacunae]MDN3634787.1 hypothetical protein [Neolewinella lacunae]